MENRYFQWIAGERQKEILILDAVEEEDGEVYISFKDGSRINEEFVAEINQKSLSGKMMAEISDANNCWKFRDEWVGREEEVWETNGGGDKVCVQPFIEGRKTVKLIAPKKVRIGVKKTTSAFGDIVMSPTLEPIDNDSITKNKKVEENVAVKTAEQSDPVYIMMSNSSKKDTEINMTLTISLPSKRLFDVAKESFEDGGKKTLEYIINNIDVSLIKESIKAGIEEMYFADASILHI